MKNVRCVCALVLVCGSIIGGAQGVNFQVTQITRSAEHVSIKWEAALGQSYRVESAATVGGPWEARATTNAVAGEAGWVDLEASGKNQRFYRIVMISGASGASVREGLLAGDLVPNNVALVGEQSSEVGVSAVFLASQSQGGLQLITTGTLTEQGQTWSYSPIPNDRLLVRFQSGTNLDFYITRMEGSFAGDAANFLQQSHAFDYRVVNPGLADLTVTSVIPAATADFQATLRGSLVWSNAAYQIDLALSGTYRFDNSVGYSLLDDHRITGSITASNLSLTVDQRRRYEFIANDGHSASSEEYWNNNTLQSGADRYQWNNARRQKSFKDGKPSSLDTYWQATGGVLKNGQPYGVYQMKSDSSLGVVKFLLVLPNEALELESWVVVL